MSIRSRRGVGEAAELGSADANRDTERGFARAKSEGRA